METKKVGYSFWGFLADIKMDKDLRILSTPDGNAFYSWSIIKELQSREYTVINVMPDRDYPAVDNFTNFAFSSFAMEDRYNAYMKMVDAIPIEYHDDISSMEYEDICGLFDRCGLKDCDYILHEWRMEIKGRNDIDSRGEYGWQPDLFLQDCLIKYCEENDLLLFIFDLDYKLTKEQYDKIKCSKIILDLGNKWDDELGVNSLNVKIPFDIKRMNDINYAQDLKKNELVYIGNRYERDWCIDKYFSKLTFRPLVHGNWNESGRDSKNRWPNINFGRRLQSYEIKEVYSKSTCTVLFAKEDYCRYDFVTARLLESLYFGCIPLFIDEFSNHVKDNYCGKYKDLLVVKDSKDLDKKVKFFNKYQDIAKEVIEYMRERLYCHDASLLINMLEFFR